MTHHHASWSELGNLKKGRTSFASAVSARMEIPFSCKIAVTVFGKGKSHRLPKQRNFTTKTSESTGNTTSTYRTSIRLIRSIYCNSLMLLLEHLHQKFIQKLDGGSSTFTFFFQQKKPRGKASTIYIYHTFPGGVGFLTFNSKSLSRFHSMGLVYLPTCIP